MKYGIDVSQWQGVINFNSVKTDFVIIRAGYGKEATQIDTCFEANYRGCKAHNIPCGAYWYSYAMSVADAEKEAETCLRALKGKRFEYPIYFDVEEQRTLALGKSAVSDIIKAFLKKVEAAGYFVGLYMSASPLTNCVTDDIKKRYAVWIAHYGVQKPAYSGNYGMWQKSSKGKTDGIQGNVDINECYVEYPSLIKSAGLNGFKAESSPAPVQKKSKAVEMVIDGVKYKGRCTKMYDKSRIYWTKAIVEEFVKLGNLTKTEEAVFRMRAKELTVTEISLKLHLSESTVKRIISKVKAKYDAVQTDSPLLPPRRYSFAEKYMDSH